MYRLSRFRERRGFTPPAQYKPGEHVGIINKKHDEHGNIHIDISAAATDEDDVRAPSNELKSTRFLPKLDYSFLDDSQNLSLSVVH